MTRDTMDEIKKIALLEYVKNNVDFDFGYLSPLYGGPLCQHYSLYFSEKGSKKTEGSMYGFNVHESLILQIEPQQFEEFKNMIEDIFNNRKK